jgi:phospholipase C
VLPYPLHPQPSEVVKCFSGLPHDYKSGYEAVNGGRNDQWAVAKSPQTMAYYQGADIPFHFALAEAFTICDAYHCSVNGPTHPNRLFLWSGTNGQGDTVHGPRIDNNDKPYQFGWTTYPERLEAAGISWQLYQNAIANNGKDQFGATNAGLNALQWFKPYDHRAEPASALVGRGNAVKTLDDLRTAVRPGHPGAGIVDRPARRLLRAPPVPARLRRHLHGPAARLPDCQPRGLEPHRPLHHLRRE